MQFLLKSVHLIRKTAKFDFYCGIYLSINQFSKCEQITEAEMGMFL